MANPASRRRNTDHGDQGDGSGCRSLYHRSVERCLSRYYQKLLVAHWSSPPLLNVDEDLIREIAGREVDDLNTSIEALKLSKPMDAETLLSNPDELEVTETPPIEAIIDAFREEVEEDDDEDVEPREISCSEARSRLFANSP
jgi:hypothetical protein